MAALDDIEELALCSCCRRAFDETERAPKLLACKHTFCLHCTGAVLTSGTGAHARCAHCGKRTELPHGAAALPTHRALLALARRLRLLPDDDEPWCTACAARASRACRRDHAAQLRAPRDALLQLRREARLLLADLTRLAARQRSFLLRALDATTALKLRLEAELAAPPPHDPAPALLALAEPDAADALATAAAERDRLRARHADALLQCRLDDLIRDATAPLDFEQLRHALAAPAPAGMPQTAAVGSERRDPLLFLANYSMAALYARHCAGELEARSAESALSPLAPQPGDALPRFYLDVEVDGTALGRVIVQVRADVAPRMARNFALLVSGAQGVGYRGCSVFQCWRDESVIAGDFELNNGRGGRSALPEAHFLPDESRLAAVRGAVGMRREQRRRDRLGLVGSQFRIVLREMRGFTAIFGSVVQGLELVDRLSRTGDGAGKPHGSIVIAACGRLD